MTAIHGEGIRFGVHTGQQFAAFGEARDLWQTAEGLGYDWVSLFDHLRPTERPTGPCFEGLTLLSALAASTRRVRCGMLVLAVPYRHPALVASMAATIDCISGGRLELGLGAGSADLCHDEFGVRFPGIGTRIDMLREACEVLRRLWSEERAVYDGRYYQLKEALLLPKPLQERLPLVIGAAGPRMLGVAAAHADIWNTFTADLESYRAKVDVLRAHCERLGRSPGAIRRSIAFRVMLADTPAAARARFAELVGPPDDDSPARRGWLAVGTAEQCVEALRVYRALGVQDFLLATRVPIDGSTLEIFARQVIPALRG
jgi:alkanesulfonate monooxygenase SsuD/methylene tetrahydromethanopterin reductase-like flavin-dependent oxidoreductase (luciferase family)